MTRAWSGTGPEYSIDWGGASWTLKVDGDRPGFLPVDGFGPILSLGGVAEVGRWEPSALSGASLEGFEIRAGRVEATYAPEGWHGLRVRAAWSPWEDDGIDLEVQLQASSVGELSGVEVQTITTFNGSSGNFEIHVYPRDPLAAVASYDGREPRLDVLMTAPIQADDGLWVVPDREGHVYAEMTRPGDWSRRIFDGNSRYQSLRQGLFGYDLEKGVVLRAHLRALWTPTERVDAIDHEFRRFLAEPPALGT